GVQVRPLAGRGRRRVEQRITEDRVPDPGQVHPDLVPTSGQRGDRQQRVLRVRPEPDEPGDRGVRLGVPGFGTGDRPGAGPFVEDDVGAVAGHAYPVLAADGQRQVYGAALGQPGGAGDGQVRLADRPPVELAGQVAVVAQLLGEEDRSGGRL